MKIILISSVIFIALFSQAQIVNIPDANFKAALVAHDPVIDTNGDGEIQVSEASAYDQALDVSYKNISNLTGIEAFTALTELRCYANQLTTLDVSNNTALTNLDCEFNHITSLDLSNNLDLNSLNINYDRLTSLDVSNNTALAELLCRDNLLTTLDVSNNTALSNLDCESNHLTSLDLSNNLNLDSLNCGFNQLTSLALSNNTALTELKCRNNLITGLDLSDNTVLARLFCFSNQLTSLNIRNGNNINFSGFIATSNPDLYCIEVDDVAWSTVNWVSTSTYPVINSQMSFSTDCSTSINEYLKTDFKAIPNPFTDKIELTLEANTAYQIRMIDLLGKELLSTNVTGIKHTLSTSSLPSGTYLLQVVSKDGVSNKKVIKE